MNHVGRVHGISLAIGVSDEHRPPVRARQAAGAFHLVTTITGKGRALDYAPGPLIWLA
jgi:hypothetical protein